MIGKRSNVGRMLENVSKKTKKENVVGKRMKK